MIKERDSFFDNLKGILMILVLIGHFGGDNTRSNIYLQTIEVFIYLFHMPLFVFVSGYFSKNLEKNNKNSFKNIFLLYVVFQILWGVWTFIFHGDITYFQRPFYPGPLLWYILALFVWKKFLPDILKIKHNFLLSIILYILSTFLLGLNTVEGALGRIIAFLPYFLLGYYIDKSKIEKIKNYKYNKIISIIVILIFIILSYFFIKYSGIDFDQIINILCHRILVYDITSGIVIGTIINILIIPISIILGLAIICLVPSKNKILSHIGENTLPIYLCHPYFQEVARHILYTNIIIKNDFLNYGVSIFIAIIIMFILSSKFFTNIFNIVIKKINDVVFKKEELNNKS